MPKKRVKLSKNGSLLDETERDAKRILDNLEEAWHESARHMNALADSTPGLTGLGKLGNTSRARQMRDAFKSYVSDLGGASFCSYAELELARRAAALSVMAAELESRFVRSSEDFALDEYVVLTKAQMQVLKTMGLKRRQKKIDDEPKSLDEYLAAQAEYKRIYESEEEPEEEDTKLNIVDAFEVDEFVKQED